MPTTRFSVRTPCWYQWLWFCSLSLTHKGNFCWQHLCKQHTKQSWSTHSGEELYSSYELLLIHFQESLIFLDDSVNILWSYYEIAFSWAKRRYTLKEVAGVYFFRHTHLLILDYVHSYLVTMPESSNVVHLFAIWINRWSKFVCLSGVLERPLSPLFFPEEKPTLDTQIEG